MAKDYSYFKGYTTDSVRYKTKRKDEQKNKKANQLAVLKKIELELKNFHNLTEDEVDALEKRRESILKNYKIECTRDLKQDFIPFRTDKKTVIFIREKHLFKAKWLSRLGKPRIEERLRKYNKIKHKKPKGMIYWNPFID